MDRDKIFEQIENIFDLCNQRNKGFNETELDIKETITNYISKNFVISGVGWRSKQLQSFVSGFYEWHKKQGYVSVKREDWDDYIKTL